MVIPRISPESTPNILMRLLHVEGLSRITGTDVKFQIITFPFFPGGLKADLEDLLSCEVDIVTEKALHKLIRDQILKEARAI